MKPRLLFVHIAKAGGLSVRRLLKENPDTSGFECLHLHSLLCFQDGVIANRFLSVESNHRFYDIALVVVRHPLQRMISCYRYFLSGGLNQFKPDCSLADFHNQKFLEETASSLDECCLRLPEVAQRIPHFQPMTYWLKQYPDPLAPLVLTCRQERLRQDLQEALPQISASLDASLLGHHNRSHSSDQQQLLDDRSLEAVREFYADDLEGFDYSI